MAKVMRTQFSIPRTIPALEERQANKSNKCDALLTIKLCESPAYLGTKLLTLLLPTDSKRQCRHGSPPKDTSSVLPVYHETKRLNDQKIEYKACRIFVASRI
jgi:hypothetical protein